MEEKVDLPQAKGYFSVGEAAKELGLRPSTVYQYIREGAIKAEKVGNTIIIQRKEIASYQRGLSGRPRSTVPEWRFSPEGNELIGTTVETDLREGIDAADFKRALAEVKQSEKHLFKGTIARYILSDRRTPKRVQFLFIWRQTVMPSEAEIEEMLKALRAALEDVLVWETARYGTSLIWMHT